MRKKRDRAEVYDRLVILADRVLAKGNACAGCPIGCVTQEPSRAWCCGGCPKLGPNGCTVKALGCKLHLCHSESMKVSNWTYQKLGAIQKIAGQYGILFARADKEESLNAPKGATFWYWYATKNGPNASKEAQNEKRSSCGKPCFRSRCIECRGT